MTSRQRPVPRHRRFTFALAAALMLVVPAPAGAAVQIGETSFVPGAGCAGDTTYLQTGSPGGKYAAPFAGVITSWSFRASASNVPQLKFKVARPAGGDDFTTVAEEGPRAFIPGTLNTFPARLAGVQAGDVIGLYTHTGGSCAEFVAADAGYAFHVLGTDVPPGTTATFAGPEGFLRLPVSATLEPDCDADGFGDETQDQNTSSCNPPPQPEPQPEPQPKADGTLTIDANKGKVEKGRKVTLSGQYDVGSNEACEPSRQIQLQRRLKSEDDSKFATFTTVQTDSAGNYSTKVKVKKTYFYRAVVTETQVCDDETSNSQKVRVQKKKAAQEA
jgi:hypothetical protein